MGTERMCCALPLMIVVAFTVFAPGCSSDDADGQSSAVTASTDEPSSTTMVVDEGSTTSAATDGAAAATEDLFESAPGVTADTIKLGVVYADLAAIADLIKLDHGDYEASYQAMIDEVNANGGVLGRRIEPVFAGVNPIDPVGAESACIQLTDDADVFAVMGNLLGDQVLCYTEVKAVPFIGSTPTDQLAERSKSTWVSTARNADENARLVVEGFDEQGVFDGATVAVVAAATEQRLAEETVVPALRSLGIEPVEVGIITTPPVAGTDADPEVAVIAERFQASNVDLVLAVGTGVTQWTAGIEDLVYRPRLATTSLGLLRAYIRDEQGRDLSILEESVAGSGAEQAQWWADPAVQECIDIIEASGQPEILDPNTRAEGEPENLVSVNAACSLVDLFVAIAERAGADLDPDSFTEAAETLGEYEVPGYGLGNYSADSLDGDLPIRFWEWDDDAQDLVVADVVFG